MAFDSFGAKAALGPPQKGVKCNFSSPEFDKPYGAGKLSISDTEICSFSRIGQKIKLLQLFQFFGGKLRKNFAQLSIMVRL